MSGQGLDMVEVRRLLELWGQWQRAIGFDRLGFSGGDIGGSGLAEFDSDEAEWVERAVLGLAVVNERAARALTAYYAQGKELTQVADVCRCGLSAAKSAIRDGEHFLAGMIIGGLTRSTVKV